MQAGGGGYMGRQIQRMAALRFAVNQLHPGDHNPEGAKHHIVLVIRLPPLCAQVPESVIGFQFLTVETNVELSSLNISVTDTPAAGHIILGET